MTDEAIRVVFDIQAIQSPRHAERGVPRYVLEHARALVEYGDSVIQSLVLNPKSGVPRSVDSLVLSGKVRWNSSTGPGSQPLSKAFIYHAAAPFEDGTSIDELWPQYARAGDALLVVTVYDLIPLIYSHHYLANPLVRTKYEARLAMIRAADLVLTISQSTARDVVERLDIPVDRVAVIGAGVSGFWRNAGRNDMAFREAKQALPGLRRGYLFCASGIDYRKNLERLMEAYSLLDTRLRREHQLVVTCRITPGEETALREVGESLGINEDLLFTGLVSDGTLRRLYGATDLFVFPSLYEGFGFPLVEAMKSGARAITSDSSSMKEIVESPRHRFVPTDPVSMADLIQRALEDSELGQSLEVQTRKVRDLFTWEAVARKTVEAYRELWRSAEPKPVRSLGRRRPRVAVFTPMPPQASGIAAYSARLLREMGRSVDLDAYVEGDPESFDDPGSPRLELKHHQAFKFYDSLGVYDAVLYCMGNSEFHGYIYDQLVSRPGHVLAHEVRFSGFYGWYGGSRLEDSRFLYETLRAQHPELPEEVGAEGWVSVEDAERYGIYLVGELIGCSKTFMVHSDYAAELAKLQRPDLADRVRKVPFGVGEPVGPTRPDCEKPIVATLGIAAPIKGTDIFLQAAALLAKRRPDIRFAVVGGYEPKEYELELRALAETLGIVGQVVFTGHLSQTEYEQWLNRVSCAVLLRLTSNGESSAALSDCMRYGIPTIVNEIGTVSEYPQDVLALIPERPTPEVIANEVIRIVSNGRVSESMSASALSYARANSFAVAADSLLKVLLDSSQSVGETVRKRA